jgi:hypothetical protein
LPRILLVALPAKTETFNFVFEFGSDYRLLKRPIFAGCRIIEIVRIKTSILHARISSTYVRVTRAKLTATITSRFVVSMLAGTAFLGAEDFEVKKAEIPACNSSAQYIG